MNGKERNLSQFRKLSAYIMQDNQLHGNLTVEEAMSVATSLKLSTKVPKEEKMIVVSWQGFRFFALFTDLRAVWLNSDFSVSAEFIRNWIFE